LRQRLLFIT